MTRHVSDSYVEMLNIYMLFIITILRLCYSELTNGKFLTQKNGANLRNILELHSSPLNIRVDVQHLSSLSVYSWSGSKLPPCLEVHKFSGQWMG